MEVKAFFHLSQWGQQQLTHNGTKPAPTFSAFVREWGFRRAAGTTRLSAADRRRAHIPVSWRFVSGVGPTIPGHSETPASRPKLAVCMHGARPSSHA